MLDASDICDQREILGSDRAGVPLGSLMAFSSSIKYLNTFDKINIGNMQHSIEITAA